MEHLRFVGLEEQAARPAGSLPIAGRKRLEIAVPWRPDRRCCCWMK